MGAAVELERVERSTAFVVGPFWAAAICVVALFGARQHKCDLLDCSGLQIVQRLGLRSEMVPVPLTNHPHTVDSSCYAGYTSCSLHDVSHGVLFQQLPDGLNMPN